MIDVRSLVKQGFLVNQDGQFDISELIVRGGANVAIVATGAQSGDELTGGFEVDLPSFLDFCKRVLIETGTLPKWFFIGVVVDAAHSQILTYFSPSRAKFFSDVYNFIKENLAEDLPMADTETVVKDFFENNPDYRFNFITIPLSSLLTGSEGGKVDGLDIRI